MNSPNEALQRNWYLLEAWGGLMLTAKVEIIARKVEFLLPMTWARARVDGRDQPFSKPRLPGNYAFVCLSRDPRNDDLLNEQAATLTTLRGVRAVYKNAAGRYAAVPKWEIQALKEAEAEEHLEAGKAKPKTMEARFKAGAKVRIVRHETWNGQVGEFLYAVRGMATLAMGLGIKLQVPECDLAETFGTDRMTG